MYYAIQILFSVVLWIAFTVNHPLRNVTNATLRYGLSILFISLLYLFLGYITMLARHTFLKNNSDAFRMMTIIILINALSAIIFYLTYNVLVFRSLNIVSIMLNFPGYLFLLLKPLSILNLGVIVVLAPFSFTLGLLIRQTHH
ncbi:MAG: hypothetical protein LRY28_01055 [Erysipelotrichaceae bacterium]|nr:hypothetical protein [Erysipelotrichaceae bacterium]